MTDTSTNRPILSMSKTEHFYCLNLFWMFSLLFCYSLFCSVLFSFVFVFVFVCFVFVCFLEKNYLRRWMQAQRPPPPRWGRRPKTWGTEVWIPEDPFSRTEERLRKTRQRVSLSYFYSLKICFEFIRFCTLCLLACRTISEQLIFFFIFKVLSIHFQNSFILIFCHRPIILYLINFYKNSLS